MADRNRQAKHRAQQAHLQRVHDTKLAEAARNMLDATGRPLKVGQTIDIPLTGMFRGHVVQVVENVLALPGRQPQPPHIMIEFHVPMPMDMLGNVPRAYIITEPPEEEAPPVPKPEDGKPTEVVEEKKTESGIILP